MGKFVIKKTATGVKFDLLATNGQVIASSEVYTSDAACKNGIESVIKNAAVAKVEMVTRTKDRELGTRILVESGNIIDQEECGAPAGTTITVRELFFNTPVRYKFLKKDFTEGGYIEDAVSRIALINPHISFRMINNKKTVLQTNGNGDMQSVVYSVYVKDIANNLVDVYLEYEDIKITGVAGKPEIARSNRSNQLFYVNGRFIKDKILSAATEEAYRTLIPNGKFGFCILNIRMNPEMVDVNVHPAKLEVRFSEEGKIFKAINFALKNALLKQDITSARELEEMKTENISETNSIPKEKKGLFDIFRPKILEKTREVIEDKRNDNVTEVSDNKESVGMKFGILEEEKGNVISIDFEKEYDLLKQNSASKLEKKNISLEQKEEDFDNSKMLEDDDISWPSNDVRDENKEIENIDGVKEELEVYSPKTQNNIFDAMNEFEDKANIPEYQIVGTAFSTYILLQLENEIYILDQHAAHERVLYEKVKQNFYKDGGKDVQMLLMPDVLELSKKDMRTVFDHIELFEQAGFVLEEFGDNTIKIMGVPVICYEMNTKDLFIDILDGIDITNRTTTQEVEEKFLSTVACKAAIKANMSLDEREIRGLLDQLLLLENPFTCPHGRPTAIRITKLEIEKKFGRK